MRTLILGGTLYLGRHIVEAARARGHTLTLFHRGRTNPDLFPEVERVLGDRDTVHDTWKWDANLPRPRVVQTGVPIPPPLTAEREWTLLGLWRERGRRPERADDRHDGG